MSTMLSSKDYVSVCADNANRSKNNVLCANVTTFNGSHQNIAIQPFDITREFNLHVLIKSRLPFALPSLPPLASSAFLPTCSLLPILAIDEYPLVDSPLSDSLSPFNPSSLLLLMDSSLVPPSTSLRDLTPEGPATGSGKTTGCRGVISDKAEGVEREDRVKLLYLKLGWAGAVAEGYLAFFEGGWGVYIGSLRSSSSSSSR